MRHILTILFISVIVSVTLFAQQKDTVNVPDYYSTNGTEGTLNDAVQTAITAGKLSNTVFKLSKYGLYILTGTITTPAGATFEIVADPPGTTQQAAPPMVAWTESTAPNKAYLFDVPGQLKMKNIWLNWSGVEGTRFASTIRVGDSASVTGGRIECNNVIFDYVDQASSGAIQPYATHFRGIFKNCYFKNCTDAHFRYYSRAVSFPYNTTGLHSDTVSFENCTFANIGYVYMQEGAEYGDNVFFNHCTFYNVVMFPLESGWWWKMYVTNSLFINTFMFGRIPANDGGGNGGTIAIAPIDSSTTLGAGFGFKVPFTEQDRRILFANNNYYIDQWLVDWMGYGPNGSPYSKAQHKARHDDAVPTPQPMMNRVTKAFFDSTDANGKKVFPYMNRTPTDSLDPGFINPPINLDSLKKFLNFKWDNNADCEWAWKPENSYKYQKWPFEESLAYTNATLKTAAMGGFPLGDLRWFPDQYSAWSAQADKEHQFITNWLETGSQSGSDVKEITGKKIPGEYVLNQNFPNPFNPTTQIQYSVPKNGYVSLKVYNAIGQEVAILFSGMQRAGNYEATFDGKGFSSGIYFYRLQADNVSITKKFVLLK